MRLQPTFWAAVLVTAVCVLGAQAQQKDPRGLSPAQPYPALAPSQSSTGESSSSSTESSEGNDSPIPAARSVNPDTRPLSGAEALTLGVGVRRSYLLPSVQFQQAFESNPTANSDFGLVSILTGGLSWNQVGRRQQLAMGYHGGGLFGRNEATYNSSFHTLDVRHTLVGRRWGLLLSDSFSYLPEASFGFVGLQGVPSSDPGLGGPLGSGSEIGGVPALNPYFSPQDTILSSGGQRIANQSVAQMNFVVSPRASITATGSFGVLHFLDPGFIDSKQTSFTAGYNYALNTSDSVAVIYGASFFRFDGVQQRIQSQFVHATYGKRLTGRLAWRIAAGPQFLRFPRSLTATDTTVSASVENTLTYQLRRTGVDLSYMWHTSNGAGLILGSNTQDARATISRQLSRAWSASIDVGYARNTSLPQLTGASEVTFNTWRGGVSLSRRLGRNSNLFLTYSANGQNSDRIAPCVGTCAPDRVRHYILIGINWGTRPIVLD